MENYFKAVTLGAFTWKKKERIELLLELVSKMSGIWLVVHFLLITLCLSFPVTFQIARISPFELYSRLFGENFSFNFPDASDEGQAAQLMQRAQLTQRAAEEDFNLYMMENDYGRNILLPLLGIMYGILLIIQVVFYFSAVFFLKLSRMNFTPLSFRQRIGLSLFSSTLPVLIMSLFGLYLPTVHIILYYFIVIFFIFQRSKLCQDG